MAIQSKEVTSVEGTELASIRDPKNWTFKKKALILSVLWVSLFAGYAAPFVGQLNLKQQSALYGKTPVQMTYANSAASAGLATGGFIFYILSRIMGRTSVIFWALICCLGTQIWGVLMTNPDDYIPYLLSRGFAGFFGMVVSVLGPSYIIDLFPVHQRGRAFTILHLALNIGASAGPTFSGFIAANGYWTTEYWWSVAVLCVAIVLVFLFLEETGFGQSEIAQITKIPKQFFSNRAQTLFPGSRVVQPTTSTEMLEFALLPLKIAISPVILLIAGFDMISFGFYVALNALTPVWLQNPITEGGYGFSVTENAAFTFVHWIGLFLVLFYGQFFSDYIPARLAARNNGVWIPEHRLHILWLPSFVLMPIGLGLVGATLQYHLHWTIFALGQIFVTIGSLLSIPVTVNYISECFEAHAVASIIPVNTGRLLIGLTINFYINQWINRVTIGWVYGMMALLTIFSFCCVIILMWKGPTLRRSINIGTTRESDLQLGESHVREIGTRKKSVGWYTPELVSIDPRDSDLFTNYSHIKTEDIIPHIKTIRDRAWDGETFPFPCIGQFRFFQPNLSSYSSYKVMLARIREGDMLLDLGCGFAPDIRRLVYDGAPASNLYGADLDSRMINLSYDLFNDRGRLNAELIAADIFAEGGPLNKLKQKMTFVHIGMFLHQFNREKQVLACRTIVSLMKPEKEVKIFGQQIGSETPREVLSGDHTIYKHDPQTFKLLWEEVGTMTGSRWHVEVTMDEGLGIKQGGRLWDDKGTRRLSYTITRLE